MSTSRDFEELFGFFLSRKARFVIVGAHAVALHAKPRYTKDIDLFVEPSLGNAQRVFAALADFGFGSVGVDASDFTKPDRVIQLGIPPNRIDLLTGISGVTFDEAWAGRVEGKYGAHVVHYIGKPELIRNKRASGRPRDLIDLQWLEE